MNCCCKSVVGRIDGWWEKGIVCKYHNDKKKSTTDDLLFISFVITHSLTDNTLD